MYIYKKIKLEEAGKYICGNIFRKAAPKKFREDSFWIRIYINWVWTFESMNNKIEINREFISA